jgi:hypothetical protein
MADWSFARCKADDSLRGLRILRCHHSGPNSILGQCGICGR